MPGNIAAVAALRLPGKLPAEDALDHVAVARPAHRAWGIVPTGMGLRRSYISGTIWLRGTRTRMHRVSSLSPYRSPEVQSPSPWPVWLSGIGIGRRFR
jgi:hypothetical protein